MMHGRRNGQRHASGAWQADQSEDGPAMRPVQGVRLVEVAAGVAILASWILAARSEIRARTARVVGSSDTAND